MSLPPRPPGDPLVGHTVRFAARPFAFLDGALANANERVTLDVVGRDPVVVTAHPDDAVAVLDDPAAFGKTADFTEAFGDGIISAEGDRWESQRELLEPLFYPSRIREYADVMVRCARERVAEWTPGEVIDLESEMKALTLEVLFAALLGRELDPEADAALYESAAGLNAMFRPTSWALPSWVPTPSRREFDRARATLRTEVERLLAHHARGDGDPDSLLGRVLAARDDSRLDDAVVRDLMVGIVFAGHETTALSLAFATHAIGSRPALAERVHAEADALDGDPTYGDVADLDVTGRVLAETLRLYPPVHSIPRVTRRDVALGEHDVPADTELLVSVYRAHRRPDAYADPETFDPSRWERAPVTTRDPGTYLPFGRGPRSCLGRRFARVEAQLVLATLARRYRLEPETETIELAPEMTTQPVNGVPVRVRER